MLQSVSFCIKGEKYEYQNGDIIVTEAGACVLRMEIPICHMISKQENICLQTWHGSFSQIIRNTCHGMSLLNLQKNL